MNGTPTSASWLIMVEQYCRGIMNEWPRRSIEAATAARDFR